MRGEKAPASSRVGPSATPSRTFPASPVPANSAPPRAGAASLFPKGQAGRLPAPTYTVTVVSTASARLSLWPSIYRRCWNHRHAAPGNSVHGTKCEIQKLTMSGNITLLLIFGGIFKNVKRTGHSVDKTRRQPHLASAQSLAQGAVREPPGAGPGLCLTWSTLGDRSPWFHHHLLLFLLYILLCPQMKYLVSTMTFATVAATITPFYR